MMSVFRDSATRKSQKGSVDAADKPRRVGCVVWCNAWVVLCGAARGLCCVVQRVGCVVVRRVGCVVRCDATRGRMCN